MRTTGPLALLLAVALALSACTSPEDPSTAGADPGPSASTPSGDAPSDTGPVTLAFAGDVHFEGGFDGTPARGDSTLGPMSSVLREADFAMVNLEAALTTSRRPARKELEVAGNRYWFRSSPAVLDLFARSGVDAVSVANNHGADFGVAGLRETVAAAEDSEVAVLGVGLDDEQAHAPLRTTVRGTDLAVFAADASPRESASPTWAAAPGTGPGLAAARGRDADRLVEAVAASAQAGELTVVYLHWGEEGASCPTGGQQQLARRLAEAGADVVVGAHAHVVQGAGLLQDTYVAYGLGNFFWYHGRQPDTGVLTLTVEDDAVVADQWSPGLFRPQGGNPQPLTRPAGQDAALERWRELRGCTDLAPGPTDGAGEPAADGAGDATDGAADDPTDDPGEEQSGEEQAGEQPDALPAFSATTRRIGPALRARMTASHDPATCPVPLADLRHLTVSRVGFDGQVHDGVIVVAADVVDDVRGVFRTLYEARFPIQRMRLVDAYGGDDEASMAANNTSGYNCRRVAGSSSWSDHAYGRAVDINPVQNPYVLGETVLPPAGRDFLDVDRSAGADLPPGVIGSDDVVRRAFDRIGWAWGGDYTEPDYQHFAAP